MMRSVTLLALLLSACARPGPVPAPRSPQEQACAAAANDDPALKEQRAISAGRLDYQFQNEPQIEQIRRDAITRCLQSRGLAPRGGVERAR